MAYKKNDPDFVLRLEAAKAAPMQLVCQELDIEFSDMHHMRCPLPKHPGDNTPSFKFYENNSFACFGCKAGGSTLDLVSQILSIRTGEALTWIESRILKRVGHPSLNQFGLLTKQMDHLKTRLQNKFNKRTKFGRQILFNSNAYSLELSRLIREKGEEIAKTSHPSVHGTVTTKTDELLQYLDDSLAGGASREQCEEARAYVFSEFVTLGSVAETLSEMANDGDADEDTSRTRDSSSGEEAGQT